MSTDIPKTVEHVHQDDADWPAGTIWTDAGLIEHVTTHHDIEDQPWLVNGSNMLLLVELHQRAHEADPISF